MTNQNKKHRDKGGFDRFDLDEKVPSSHIRNYLKGTEDMIGSLRNELEHYRAQNESFLRERDDSLRLQSRADLLRTERDGIGNELEFIRNTKEQLELEVGQVQQENRLLRARCYELEALLADEQNKREEAQQVVMYLEAQIQQLEIMVEMLREHERFMED